MRVAISNANELMDWDATVGDETKRFSFPGKSYGFESNAAFNEALAWIEHRVFFGRISAESDA